ncbi:AraC family transcriptional regulator [Ornithobacterium rhinotracheale]|uniref:AraC family transcriptional regulator n=1 Tax=Ornithobacterium rhinotracheale TaxID=28251 RepID=UPI001FB918A9|nr:helix-turn-helix domain-containing protein [Ornithobacterium rhinotracheale]MRJ08590.1 AraC family transcriptional regulator [Ornithobacterium rhinotracheale]UOH76964.1 helix-turn-helix transcriptional regulator [Ornithobacterium rhinotracheale]
MEYLYQVSNKNSQDFAEGLSAPYYYILAFDGDARFSVDFVDYNTQGKTLLFLSPYQLLKWEGGDNLLLTSIAFHGDFYCIEYHKKEVACNGILFNNIYDEPNVAVSDETYAEVLDIVQKIKNFGDAKNNFDNSILKTYLQLILALSSKEKQHKITNPTQYKTDLTHIASFQQLIEKYFLTEKSPSFYADLYGVSVSAFSKKIKKHFGKTPTQLLQERTILEAKKQLHLTYQSVKEIASNLGFEDEFYFSRYFKNAVGISPTFYRDEVGISIVAK